MISKNQLKLIHSLEQKKYRTQNNLFVAEGPKTVGDLMRRIQPKMIFATQEWLDKNTGGELQIFDAATQINCVTANELRQISFQQHPQEVLALFPLPAPSHATDAKNNIILALDGVQDPGNLGTIIRIADWFGIDTILCSTNTADAFSPKVVQATMGSIARVNIVYCDLVQTLTAIAADGVPVYGTLLDGSNIYSQKLTANGVIVMGNEGNGISEQVRTLVTHKLLIPSFTKSDDHAESLNVAIATAVTLSEFRR